MFLWRAGGGEQGVFFFEASVSVLFRLGHVYHVDDDHRWILGEVLESETINQTMNVKNGKNFFFRGGVSEWWEIVHLGGKLGGADL